MIKRNAKKAGVPKFNQRVIFVYYEVGDYQGNIAIQGTGGAKLSTDLIISIKEDIRKIHDDVDQTEPIIIKNIMGL